MNKNPHKTLIKSPSIGLALSGGGARGFAHIGVIRVLEREGISVNYLAGTSMGGVMAAGYASGMSSYDLERETLAATRNNNMVRMVDPGLLKGGLIRGKKTLAFFKQIFGEKTFVELPKKLAVVAVDLKSHQEVILQEGSVAMALRATTSLPGIFEPFEMNGQRLVDGGLLNNLPVDVVRSMGAEVVIAVDIGLSNNEGIGEWIGRRRWIPRGVANTLDVVDECLYAMRIVEQESKMRQFPPDLFISPNLPANVNSIRGYSKAEELIAAGEQAAEEHLQEIKDLLRLN